MKELRPVQVILLGFLITIFAGSILLALPIATQSGQATPYIDALFTATTSVCVTGLIVETTMTHWSIFWAGSDHIACTDRRTWCHYDHNRNVFYASKEDHSWK